MEERAKAQQRMTLEGGLAVTPEQVTAALRIDVRKISSRRSLKPATSALKCDQRVSSTSIFTERWDILQVSKFSRKFNEFWMLQLFKFSFFLPQFLSISILKCEDSRHLLLFLFFFVSLSFLLSRVCMLVREVLWLCYDWQEYLRFKQKKGWKRLAVYKSGIHALGLYTTDFIAEGEVVRFCNFQHLISICPRAAFF